MVGHDLQFLLTTLIIDGVFHYSRREFAASLSFSPLLLLSLSFSFFLSLLLFLSLPLSPSLICPSSQASAIH